MATKFNPLKFYAFNNVKVLSDPSDIVLYADSVDLRKRFEALLAQVNAGEDSNFDDIIRLITGLGFLIVPDNLGVLSEPLPLFNRSDIFTVDTPSPGNTKITLLPKEREIVGDLIYKLFKSFNPADKVFQDKNFFIPNVEDFNISVDVVATKANVLDIYKNDQLFTNGELEPTKDEKSLTYAYAFESYEVQGTQELIIKKVELASPNNEKFIEEANNESNFDIVDQLRNIVYDGQNTADIEAQVLQGDSLQDIGIDKLYNIVTIEIPKLTFGFQQSNILDYLFTQKSDVNPPSTKQTFLTSGGIFDTAPWGVYTLRDLITELSFLRYIDIPDELSKIFAYNFNLDTIQVPKAQAEFLAKTATKKDVNLGKIADFKSLQSFLKQVLGNDVIGNLSTVQTEPTPEFIEKFVNDQEIIAVDSYFRLLEGLYNKREVANPTSIIDKMGLTRFNISELFQGLVKKPFEVVQFGQGPLIQNASSPFTTDARQAALYRNSRLAGIKVVKSRIAYDPVNPAGFDQSIIQTFFISTQQDVENKTIRLFDSQVVYGREYFYTAFGVYEIDGKFYTYDNIDIDFNAEKIATGNFIEKPNVFEQGPAKGFFVNPCCRGNNIDNNFNLYGRQANLTLGNTPEEIASKFFDLNESITGLSKSPNKADILLFATKGIGQPSNTVVPGINNINTMIKQGAGFITPPIDFNDPAGYPVLTKLLFDLYLGTKEPSFLGITKGPKFAPPIYSSQFAYGFKNVGATTTDLDYFKGFDEQSTKIANFLNEKRKEMFCFLCRRAGTTNPNIFPSPAKIIEETLRDLGYLSKDLKKPESKFLGGLVDCRLFGYVNADGLPADGFKLPGQAGFAGQVGSPLAAAGGNCKKKEPIFETKRVFNSIKFDTNEMDSKTIVEVPLDDDKATIVGRVPMPPDVTFVPLADVDDKVLIRFLEAVQNDDFEQPIDAMISFLNGTAVMEKLKEQSGSEDFVLARSQGDLQSVIMFRSDVEPSSLSDLILNESVKNVNIDWSTAEILDPILPNKDYWYVFATRDFTGLYSAASPVFRLKLVNDSGYTYADLEPYEFVVKEQKTTTKTFKKLIKIKPSFDETLANNAEQVGTLKLFSTIKKGDAKGTNNAPPKFKIRITSRKTKRAFDINLKYTQEIQQISSKKLLKVIKDNAELIDEKITGIKKLSGTISKPIVEEDVFIAPQPAPTQPTGDPFDSSTVGGKSIPIPVPEDLTKTDDIPSPPPAAEQPVFDPFSPSSADDQSIPIPTPEDLVKTDDIPTAPPAPNPENTEGAQQQAGPFIIPPRN